MSTVPVVVLALQEATCAIYEVAANVVDVTVVVVVAAAVVVASAIVVVAAEEVQIVVGSPPLPHPGSCLHPLPRPLCWIPCLHVGAPDVVLFAIPVIVVEIPVCLR